jgi:4-carboxymuconolactone decarboxylase
MAEPRIAPLGKEDWPEQWRSLPDFNIFATLARHPDLMSAWLPFGGYLLGGGTLSARDRELLILRTAVNCGSDYEWGQHVRIGLDAGLTREEIDRAADGPDVVGWTEAEAALLRASDELYREARISGPVWEALAGTYDERQLIEITFLVGQYHMLAFALNSLGVELDADLETLPAARS